MPRASWKGFIKLSLVSVPVKGFTASSSGGGKIHLNQLHEECHSRIRYRKICPIHGEVPSDEIVMGYEYAKDQYAVIDPAELDKLRSESDRSISINQFIRPEHLDPMYYAGKTYFLTPDGRAGQKPYSLLHRAMIEEDLFGIAQVVISNREQLVVLRPLERLLTINMLHYASELKTPGAFEDELSDGEIADQELKLAKTLVAATTSDEFEIDGYKDLYEERLASLVDAKVEGKEVAAAPPDEGPAVINLMDALKASVAKTKAALGEGKRAPIKKKAAKKKLAASARARTTTRKKKKSG